RTNKNNRNCQRKFAARTYAYLPQTTQCPRITRKENKRLREDSLAENMHLETKIEEAKKIILANTSP
ncbi:7732_t:CDS:2, partial [Gigaspora rosea]